MGPFNFFKKSSEQVTSSNGPTEFAKVIDWPYRWSAGAPCPQVYSNGHKTFLLYYLDEPDPGWDGSHVKVIDNSSDNVFPLALVEFVSGGTFRFGIVNDEAASGHPLYNKGLQIYDAHIIENSTWIEELKNIHKVHPYFDEKRWLDLKHYLFFFHDEIFEVIATDYKIEIYETSFRDLAIEVAKRINS